MDTTFYQKMICMVYAIANLLKIDIKVCSFSTVLLETSCLVSSTLVSWVSTGCFRLPVLLGWKGAALVNK